MATLRQVLTEHRRHRGRHALSRNLGDGFLLNHNPVYRAIRENALRSGFRFSSKRFYDYDVLPLTQLPMILKRKVIPYRDNVTPLDEIEKRAKGVFQFHQIPRLKPNHVFHESAHAVARALTKKHLKKPKTDEETALHLLFEESFSNACESLANAYSGSALHDEFLYKNSYIMENTATRKTIRDSVRKNGEKHTFKVLVFSFLHANLLQTGQSRRNLPRVSRLISSPARPITRSLFRVGADLDPLFTEFTNAFCLRLEGITRDLTDLYRFDFMESFEKNSHYLDCLEEMAAVVSE